MADLNNIRLFSIDELLNLEPEEWMSLSKREQKKVVQRLTYAANKRLSRLEAAGLRTPATMALGNAGIKRFTNVEDLDSLKGETISKQRLKLTTFMQKGSSTVSGARKYWDSVINSAAKKNISMSTINIIKDKILKLDYDKWGDKISELIARVIPEAIGKLPGMSADEIATAIVDDEVEKMSKELKSAENFYKETKNAEDIFYMGGNT